MKQAQEFLPEKLFREIEQTSKQQSEERKKKKKKPVYGQEVEKGLKTGQPESGTHPHSLIRNLLKTGVDGRHRHLFVVRDVRGQLIQLITELDGEHWHTMDEPTSKNVKEGVSAHQHIVRISFEILLDNGETLHPGMVFITKRDGAHVHGADMLETTNFDGAHPHILELPGDLRIQSLDIAEFWEMFGPFDLTDVSPIFSTDQIQDRFSEPCLVAINKSYSGYLEIDDKVPDWKLVLAASMGTKLERVEKEEIIFKQDEVQEVILSKRKFKDLESAKDKLADLEYQNAQVEDQPNVFRAEVKRPSEFKRDSLRELRLETGVRVVVGIPKNQIVRKQTEIQTLVFSKDKFTEKQARDFAKRNDFKTTKIDTAGPSFRIRQRDPGDFTRLRTITLPGSDGVKATVGPVKKEAEERDFERVAEVCPEKLMICKRDDEKRIVTGIVLEPDVVDLQGDIITEDEIEKSAAFFLQKSRTIGFRHRKKAKANLVGSMVMPAAFTLKGPNGKQKVRKGTWLISVHVPDDKEWSDIKKKDINAFSVGGFGSREPIGKDAAGFGSLNWATVN